MATLTRVAAMLCIYTLSAAVANAQYFQEIFADNHAVHYHGGESSGGCTMHDWNEDGWDDVIVCQNDAPPRFFQNTGGEFVEVESPLPDLGEAKQITFVDFDNDGDKDICATAMGETVKIFRNTNGQYEDISEDAGILDTEYTTFGHNWGDYNNDGFLDLYINNYDYFDPWPNQFYHNNGDGTFTEMANEVGIDDFFNFSFQAIWFDYNEDGWQDLFVINDRLYSENHLYRNDGGTFTNVSDEMNVEYTIFSMSSTVGDYDNDGDMDIYVTNNPTGHLLHQMQDDGTYLEVADAAGVATYDMGWAAQWLDYDLDGWQDLHVNASPFWSSLGQNKFYINNQDGTFTYNVDIGFQNDQTWSHSSAIGDINNDGCFDIFVLNDFPDKSKLWKGFPGDNNFLKVNFEGVVSNKDGIGTLATCYANDLIQKRYTYCGEAYLSQNSEWEIFGLGQAEVIDSLSVTWLSGHTDWFYNIPANSTLEIVEGSSLAYDLADLNSAQWVCPGDSIQITGPDGFDSYLWSNGDTTQTTWLFEQQIIQLSAYTEEGVPVTSPWYDIFEYDTPSAEFLLESVACAGDSTGSIVLNLENAEAYSVDWGDVEGDLELNDLVAGVYTCNILDSAGCVFTHELELIEPSPISSDLVTTDVLCFGDNTGTAAINIEGGTGELIVDWMGQDPQLLAAGTYAVTITDSLSCVHSMEFTIDGPEELQVNLTLFDQTDLEGGEASVLVTGGVEPYSVVWSNNEEGLAIYDLEEGDYEVVVTDANGCSWETTFAILYSDIQEAAGVTLSLYPNPVTSQQLKIDSNLPIVAVRMYAMDGGKILDQFYSEVRTTTLDVSTFANGMYVVEVVNSNGTILKRSIGISK